MGEGNGGSGRREVEGQRSSTGDQLTEKGRQLVIYSVLKVEHTRGVGVHTGPRSCLPALSSLNIRLQPVEARAQTWPPPGLLLPKRSLTFEFPPRAPRLGSKCTFLLFLRRSVFRLRNFHFSRYSGPQPFWHQGLVLWKTIFQQPRAWRMVWG